MGLLDQIQPKQTGGLLGQLPSDDALSKMSQYDLYQLRLKARGMPELQAKLAPFEHQATAREQVAISPWTSPAWALMPAGYQAFKALGGGEHDDMTTPASLEQAWAGIRGTGEGLAKAFGKYFK